MADITFYRDIFIDAVDAGDTILLDDGELFYVDEVRRSVLDIELLGYAGDRRNGKRNGRRFDRQVDPTPIRVIPDQYAEAALLRTLMAEGLPQGRIRPLNVDTLTGFHAQLGDWTMAVAMPTPPLDQEVGTPIGRIIDVTETEDGVTVSGVIDGHHRRAAALDIGLPDPDEEAAAAEARTIRLATH